MELTNVRPTKREKRRISWAGKEACARLKRKKEELVGRERKRVPD